MVSQCLTKMNWTAFPKPIRQEIRKLRENIPKYSKLSDIDWNSKYKFEQKKYKQKPNSNSGLKIILTITIFCLLFGLINLNSIVEYFLSVRCIMPNNYLVYEASRPIESNCKICKNIKSPLILQNLTQAEFATYAYLPQPIIMKNAFMHWPARNLTFKYLRDVYKKWPDALNRFSDECQFLPFKSTFASLSEFINMPESQVNNGKPTWYIGFSNCLIQVLTELRALYPRPHFLPTLAEIPNTDYLFLGYNEGAVMHLDYVSRLMWQAQLRGKKMWKVKPIPECDSKCSSFSFYVEPGDAVLIDTRRWYHGTMTHGFSLTIQSEYG